MINVKYCPHCNFATSVIELQHARFNYDCPNCNNAVLSEFYTNGSLFHLQLLEASKGQFNNALPIPSIIKQSQTELD